MRGLILFLSMMVACNGDKTTADSGSSDTSDAVEVTAVCEQPVEVSCVDQLILDLSLHDDKSADGDVSTEVDGDDFVSVIDASAGGYNSATNNPWVYVRFTEDGLEQVSIDDETALESMDWDMSLRRFIIRLNGGASGPSCVGAASFLESSYDDLTEVPDGLSFAPDAFYTEDCTIINDSSGLPGSPQVVLSPWWSYSGCVETTMVPHLIQLADGHIVKLVIESYYDQGQEECNQSGTPGDDSAIYTVRWSWMTR